MKLELHGKRVLVTGGSRGIGLAIAMAFAREGARVAICARDPVALQKAGQRLHEVAPDVLHSPVDVTNTQEVQAFVKAIADTWDGIDILINNAGQTMAGGIDEIGPDVIAEHAQMLQIAHYRVAQAVIPHMRKQRWGRIIGINAVVGHQPTPSGIAPVVNRAACLALSNSLSMALGPDNILVNSVNLGWIDTGQWGDGGVLGNGAYKAAALKTCPVGRMGTPEDVTGIVLFLASEHASYISGASIDVAGGLKGQIAYFGNLVSDAWA